MKIRTLILFDRSNLWKQIEGIKVIKSKIKKDFFI